MAITEEANAPTDFIREIVREDVKNGKHKKIVTRFPPEPNGYLHIGHAKAFCLDFGLAEEFAGQCNLRFDDTNPDREDTEYVESIKEDLKWMGFDWGDGLYFASDYFDQLYDYAVELIQQGKAYVCDLSPQEIRDYRGTVTEPGKEQPLSRSHRVGKSRSICANEKWRISRRRVYIARKGRYGIAKYEHARSRNVSHQTHITPPHG